MKHLTFTILAVGLAAGLATQDKPAKRNFNLRYLARIESLPRDTRKLRLWIPLPQSNPQQKITNLQLLGDHHGAVKTEPKYGNRMVYHEIANPPARLELGFSCTVERLENTGCRRTSEAMQKLFLQANRLVPLSADIRQQAVTVAGNAKNDHDRGRAFYRHVLREMTYDKSGNGWGRGDFRFACNVKRGNCTDFHSYFIGLCRNAGIPAYFEIGLSIPRRSGPVKGYHCWAAFWDGKAWIPVDISEADKDPARADYFFGAHCPNRVAFSRGRDLVLNPKQAGPPLNYFINPYAEADRKPVKTTRTVTVDTAG